MRVNFAIKKPPFKCSKVNLKKTSHLTEKPPFFVIFFDCKKRWYKLNKKGVNI